MYKTVSVILPVYNSPLPLVENALESIASQTYPAFEVVVVSDGSSSDYYQHLLQVVNVYPSVRLISLSENSGPATARNTGWNHAMGELIAFIDSDDVWTPTKLDYQIRIMRTYGADMVGGPRPARSYHNMNTPSPDSGLKNPAVREINLIDLVLRNRFATSTVILRTDLPVRFTPGRRHGEDWELWIRTAATGRAYYSPRVVAYDGNQSSMRTTLSDQTAKMWIGEYTTFWLLKRARIISRKLFTIGLASATARGIFRTLRNLPTRTHVPIRRTRN